MFIPADTVTHAQVLTLWVAFNEVLAKKASTERAFELYDMVNKDIRQAYCAELITSGEMEALTHMTIDLLPL